MSKKVLLSLVEDELNGAVIHLLPEDIEAEITIFPSEELLEGLIKELNPEGYDQPARAEINTVVEEIKRAINRKRAARGSQRIYFPEPK